jgi:DsbC/DsbD-like thiol-disulfide interchange protein
MNVKQNSIHKISVVGQRVGVSLTLCALCINPRVGLTQTLPKSFGGEVADVRLIAAAGPTKGAYQAGIVIAMPTGSHTYWKQPGDAGVPPVFAFNGSTNVAKAEVLFPVPARITEEGLDAFGYTDRVVFPIVVAPTDPAKPSTLHVDLTYAVCNKICIPGHSTADLTLPATGQAQQNGEIAMAFAAVPTPLPADRSGDLVLARIAGAKKPSWTLRWTGQTPLTDVFADAPEGYAFDTKPDSGGTWTLVASQVVSSTGTSVPVSLTLAIPGKSLVVSENLDIAPAP